jgi:hypothetical protein
MLLMMKYRSKTTSSVLHLLIHPSLQSIHPIYSNCGVMRMLSEIVKQVRVVLIDTNSEDLMEEQEKVLLPTVCLQSISSSLIAHFRARPETTTGRN